MRLNVGSAAPVFTAEALGGQRVDLSALRGRPLLLKFYRFATCPVCNLHMHRFIKDYPALQALGLTTVVLYHSPASKLEQANVELPSFPLVPDPEKKIFKAYGVERGLAGMFSFTVMREYFHALKAGFPPGMFSADGGVTGNPADFIIDADGQIAYAHYGRQYADSLDVEQVLNVCRNQVSLPRRLTARPQSA